MQSSVLEPQPGAGKAGISHRHTELWDVQVIFHVCRESRELIPYTACLLQAQDLEQTLCRRGLQVPALSCQVTVYFCPQQGQREGREPKFPLNVLWIWKGKIKTTCWQKLNKTFLIAGQRRKIHELLSMATSRFCHVCCLHSLLLPFFLSRSYPWVPAVPAPALPTQLSTGAGICTKMSSMSPPGRSESEGFRLLILRGTKEASCFLSCPLLLLFLPLKSLEPPIPSGPLALYLQGQTSACMDTGQGKKLAHGCLIKL